MTSIHRDHMKINLITRILIATSIAVVSTSVFASRCIGVDNQSDQTIIYSQFPDDFGDASINAHKKTVINEVAHDSENITLSNEKYEVLVRTTLRSGTTIVYFGKNHTPSWTTSAGC